MVQGREATLYRGILGNKLVGTTRKRSDDEKRFFEQEHWPIIVIIVWLYVHPRGVYFI